MDVETQEQSSSEDRKRLRDVSLQEPNKHGCASRCVSRAFCRAWLLLDTVVAANVTIQVRALSKHRTATGEVTLEWLLLVVNRPLMLHYAHTHMYTQQVAHRHENSDQVSIPQVTRSFIST